MRRHLFSSVVPRASLLGSSLSAFAVLPSTRFASSAAGLLRFSPLPLQIKDHVTNTHTAVVTPFRFESTSNTDAAGKREKNATSEESTSTKPPGYRKDPDPKGTAFQLNVLPVLYFISFWALVALLIWAVFFRGKEETTAKTEKKTVAAVPAHKQEVEDKKGKKKKGE